MKILHTLHSPSGQVSQHFPLAGSAGMGSGQGRGGQGTASQSTKLSVLKKSRENPHIQTVQNPIHKAYNYIDLTTVLKNMSSVHTIFRIANAVESSFV